MMSAAGVDVKTLAEAQAEMARLQGELADLQRAAVELQQARAPPPVAVVQESTAEFQRILESSGVSPQLIKEFRVPLEAWQRTLETVVPTLELPGAPSLPGASSLASFDMPSLPPLDGLWESPILASFSLPTLPSGVSVPTLPSLELSVPAPVPLPVLPEMPTSVAADLASASDLASAGLAALHTPLVAELTPAGAALQLGAIALFAVGSGIGRADSKNGEAPYAAGTTTYSPTTADAFYRARPLLVANRMLKLAYLTSAFTSGVLFDWLVLGKLLKDEEYTALKKAEPRRAKEALVLCEQLGPTFIKLGQALSIRTDLIPEAYALELRQLQDAVPPFASDEAYEVLRMQLGVRDLSQVFESLSPAPIASASIGQVYRGTLKDENQTAVAVKVQRPGILADIALDLHVLRLVTPLQTRLQNAVNGVQTAPEDIQVALQLVDEWGRGFVAETDYRLEAKNTQEFEASMRARGLDAVCAPRVVDDLVRDTVLVTEWVDGTRLDRDASPDVPRLCGVAINAYLTMLLDTGVLHCDPHPGNLLRTTDGKLCILDWGMTLEVPSDLQYGLLEFIAHINTEDYEAIPQDFINLGFSPPGTPPEKLQSSGITEGLSFALRQLSAGGGPKKIAERVEAELKERYGDELTGRELELKAQEEIVAAMEAQLASEGVDVKGVTNVMEEMSKRNRELFSLPPYVLYVARAFSTLEGIGLSVDEDYSIVQECYPYLSRRLFTDRSPRAKKALRAMLGLDGVANPPAADSTLRGVVVPTNGPAALTGGSASGGGGGGGLLSPAKLVEMSEGFASYTAATASVDRDGAGQAEAAKELANLVLAPEGSTLQDILVDESAKLGDAAIRRALRTALIDAPTGFVLPGLGVKPVDVLGLKPPAALAALLAESPEDEKVLSAARELSELLGPRVQEQIEQATTVPPAAATAGGEGSGSPLPLPVPPAAEAVTGTVSALLTDQSARDDATRTLEGVSALSRRLGAQLLRRAAERATSTPGVPEALSSAPTALADAIEPPAPQEDGVTKA